MPTEHFYYIMGDCTKCGDDLGRPKSGGVHNYCPPCRYLLKLDYRSPPRDLTRLGLPAGGNFNERQLAEPIPYGRNPNTWYEVL